jgi:hypothetical protein
MCRADLKNKWFAMITIPVVIYLCTDCAYQKKQYIHGLRDRLPIEITEIKGIGSGHLALHRDV